MNFSGTFHIVDWQEKPSKEFEDGRKHSIAKVKQNYEGNITGEGNLTYLMYYEASGNAKFTGFETITGHLNGERCEITMQLDGYFEGGIATANIEIIDSQLDKSLIGLKGSFQSISGGKANYSLIKGG